MFELVFLSGARAGAVVSVPVRGVAGRSPETDIEVPDPNVSRQHAVFEWDGSVCKLIDKGSSNGSFVNEQRISERALKHGDMVRFGETRIRVQRRTQRSAGSSSDDAHSSVFGMKDSGDDLAAGHLSLSMLMKPGPTTAMEDVSHRLYVIQWVAEQLATRKSLDELYGPILDTLFDVWPQAERAFLMLGNDIGHLVPKAMRIKKGEEGEGHSVSRSLCRKALEKKEALVYQSGIDKDFDQGLSLLNLNIRCAMVVPLMVRDEVLGVMAIDTTDTRKPFDKKDIELAAAVCRQIAVGIKNAMLMQDLEREALVRSNLSRFLPKPVVDQAVQGGIDLRLGGSTCTGTIFFADVIGFTRMSEPMAPEAVIAMMNGFFNEMVPCIEAEAGAVDKFMGDCVMAFWGIPFAQADAAPRAVAAGLTMQNRLAGLNSRRLAAGDPELHMGIGLEFGEVVAGNIGSEDRVEYTVLGDTVNTADRVQRCASRSQVIVGARAWVALGDRGYGYALPPIEVKNKANALRLISVRGLTVDGEILLHIPLRLGDKRALLTRRLASGDFVLLHGDDCDPQGQIAHADLTEASGITYGPITVGARMPAQRIDGAWRRSQVTLGDKTLAGLLTAGGKAIDCRRTWSDMKRGAE